MSKSGIELKKENGAIQIYCISCGARMKDLEKILNSSIDCINICNYICKKCSKEIELTLELGCVEFGKTK